MKRVFSAVLLVVVILVTAMSAEAKPKAKESKREFPQMFAHRGCWSKNDAGEFVVPENSVAAVAMAKRMGYVGIESDVHYTKDKRMVILHDATLNRTARRASDYAKLDKPVKLADLTFEELRRDYVLESADPELRTPIPTLEELLEECKRQGIIPMLHSALWESYEVAQQMFGDEWICFTGGVEHMQRVRKLSDCTILLAINDGTAEENIARLKQIGGHCGISTMNYKLYTPEFCKALTDAGYEVQASIFPAPHEAVAQRNGITYQLTDYSFMPPAGKNPKYIYKVNMSKLGVLLSALKKNKTNLPSGRLECAGQVIEITSRKGTSGEITANVRDVEYKFYTNGKEKIYIGRRLMNSNIMGTSANSHSRIYDNRDKKKPNMKHWKLAVYEM